MHRRTLVCGAFAGAAAAVLTPRIARACGVWVLEDGPLQLDLRQNEGVVVLAVDRQREDKRHRVRRRIYRLLSRDGGIAVFEPTMKRLFEIVDGNLLMWGEPVGTQAEDGGVEVCGVRYHFTIEDGQDKYRASVRLHCGDEIVASCGAALRFGCGGGGVGLQRRLIYHAMWRELVWPEFRDHLVAKGQLPREDPPAAD